jgi:hypothetical protein
MRITKITLNRDESTEKIIHIEVSRDLTDNSPLLRRPRAEWVDYGVKKQVFVIGEDELLKDLHLIDKEIK